MKFFPTNINLNVNIPKLNFNGSVSSSSNSQFLDHLNLLLTKSPQKGGILDKDVTGNDVSLAFIFLLLMTSNEKIAQSDFTKNGSNVQVSEFKKNSYDELNKLLNLLKEKIENTPKQKEFLVEKDASEKWNSLAFIFSLLTAFNGEIDQHNLMKSGSNVQLSEFKKNSYDELNKLFKLYKEEIEHDSELKKLITNLQQYLNIKEYKKNSEGLNDFLNDIESNRKNKIVSTNQEIKESIILNKLLDIYNSLKLDKTKENIRSNNTFDLKEITHLIKKITNHIRNKHPKFFNNINKFININFVNKKQPNVIVNAKLEPDKREVKDSIVGNNSKLVIEKLDKLNKQIKNILQNINIQNNEDKYLGLESIKNQIAELQEKLFDIVKENGDFLKKGQMQDTIEQLIHNIGLLKEKVENIEAELLKAGMEVQELQLDKKLLESSGNKEFHHPNDFASGHQIRAFVLNKANQGTSIPAESKFRDEIFRQIERGIFKNLGEGRREVTIKLHPPELGTLKVVMQVHNREVSMVLHTEHRDVADALNKHIANFEKSFEQQGLKVVKVEVKNDLFSGGENFLRDFTGSREHAQNNSHGFKRRNIFDLSLIGEGDISAMDHENMASLVRMNCGSLYVIA